MTVHQAPPTSDPLTAYKPRPLQRRIAPKEKKREFRTTTTKPKAPQWREIIARARNLYRYTEIDSKNEIRLLLLLPGKKESKISCRLMTRRLEEVSGRYHALSYHWGTEPEKYFVDLQDEMRTLEGVVARVLEKKEAREPKQFMVRPNLHQALQHLRDENDELLIWVDGICINQADEQKAKEEKELQVSRMAEIYNSAYSVCIWLGEGDAQSDLAIKFIPDVLDLHNLDELVEDQTTKEKWKALADVMICRWFSRRWVIQEVALAREAEVYIGTERVRWDDFSDAIAIFITKLDRIKLLFSDNELGDVEAFGANILVKGISNLFRKSASGDIQEHLVDIEILVSKFLFFECTTPHDTIYSLLSLARDAPQRFVKQPGPSDKALCQKTHEIKVDYDRDPIELFIDFVKLCIDRSKSLDIICRHWAPTVKDKDNKDRAMPSWILPIKESPFGLPGDTLYGRRSGDSLVGCPYRDSRKTYNASRGLSAHDVTFGSLARVNSDMSNKSAKSALMGNSCYTYELSVSGFPIGEIRDISDRVIQGAIYAEWLKKAGWDSEEEHGDDKVPDKLWRTLVADRGPNGENAHSWYQRACLHCLTDSNFTDRNGDLRIDDLPNKAKSDMIMQFVKRAKSVVWNRKFFLAKRPSIERTEPQQSPSIQTGSDLVDDGDLFGLAPKEAKVGDIVCILAGCTVPVVLRKHVPVNGVRGRSWYQFIGETYVYGKMDGEAIADLEQTGSLNGQMERFTLK